MDSHWHKIAEHINEIPFGPNHIAVIQVTGHTLCIAAHADTLFAFPYKCPHAGGLLAEGLIDALGNIVCPIHRYKYQLETGRNITGEGFWLKRWKVEKREDGIYIGYP
ncbi:MAG TPA: Rieske 2Fe-2S domain-containing protein [Chitinophagaceae bacterium]